jgi:hypothetical protein
MNQQPMDEDKSFIVVPMTDSALAGLRKAFSSRNFDEARRIYEQQGVNTMKIYAHFLLFKEFDSPQLTAFFEDMFDYLHVRDYFDLIEKDPKNAEVMQRVFESNGFNDPDDDWFVDIFLDSNVGIPVLSTFINEYKDTYDFINTWKDHLESINRGDVVAKVFA